MDHFVNACDESSDLLSGGHSMSGAVEDHDEFCPICSDTMHSPCITTCGHRFCSHCLVQSLRMNRPWNRGPCPICRSAVSVHTTIDALTGHCLEEPVATTIFGSTYLQGGRLGVASYDVALLQNINETPAETHVFLGTTSRGPTSATSATDMLLTTGRWTTDRSYPSGNCLKIATMMLPQEHLARWFSGTKRP